MTLDRTGQKKLRTRAALVASARRRTVEGGLQGFTVAEVCDEVGISRRTFFNYFPTKEAAVLGVENGIDDGLLARFVDARRQAPERRRRLVDDLIDLAVDHFEAMNPTSDEVDLVLAVLQREPKLLQLAISTGRAEQERFVAMLADSDDAHDPAASQVAIVAFESLVRLSAETRLRPGETRSFADILRETVAHASALFAPSASPRPSTRDLVTAS